MKSGIKTLIVGIVLFIVGSFIVPLVFILPIILDDSEEHQFVVPGTAEVEIVELGRYYLWNDYQTVHEGKSYRRSETIPGGLAITVEDEDGTGLPFSSDSSISSSRGSSSKNSIGYVEVQKPGKLTISVSGDSEPRVFSFSQSGIMKIFGLIFCGIVLSMLMAFAGVGISIWGIVRILRANTNDRQVAEGNALPSR